MKKWLFLTALTALLLGACSTENEVSQENTDKQIGFVQKEDKNSLEKARKKENYEKKRKEKNKKKRGKLAKNKKEEMRKPNKLQSKQRQLFNN